MERLENLPATIIDYLHAKIGFDTAENEPFKVADTYSLLPPPTGCSA